MSDANIIEEISKQREMVEICIKQEMEKTAAAIIQASKENIESIATGSETNNRLGIEVQGANHMKAGVDESNHIFGELPDESDEAVPEDVMSFLDEL